MGKEPHRRSLPAAALILLALLMAFPAAAPAGPSDGDQWGAIRKLEESRRQDDLVRAANDFLRDYPRSGRVPDARLILAENEPDPGKAAELFRALVNKFKYFTRRDYAQFRLCETLYLLSRWKDLAEEARKGVNLFPKSVHATQFRLFLARACIFMEQYEEARGACREVTATDHDPENLSRALLLISHIDRSTTGYSRAYITGLKELVIGFGQSETAPTSLYLLGRYYESKKDYNRAWSAYRDVMKRYPRSPESAYSMKRSARLASFNPSAVDYLPEASALNREDSIDLQPEMAMPDGEEGDSVYAVSLGPFTSAKGAREIRTLIAGDFQPIQLVRLKNRYILYVGRLSDSEAAVSMKIRLAEEFGLNGNIVRIVKDSDKAYIYGE